MKILLGVSNHPIYALQARRIFDNLPGEVMVAAYHSALRFFPFIDYLLDPIRNGRTESAVQNFGIFSKTRPLKVSDSKSLSYLIPELKEQKFDLVITDHEYFTSEIAARMKCELWYVNSANLVYSKGYFYGQSFRGPICNFRHINSYLPPGRRLAYSPFGFMGLEVKGECVMPYTKTVIDEVDSLGYFEVDRPGVFPLLDEQLPGIEYGNVLKSSGTAVVGGSTSELTDVLVAGTDRLILSSQFDCLDSYVNHNMAKGYLEHHQIGQVEVFGQMGSTYLDRTFARMDKTRRPPEFRDVRYLHELL